MTPSSTNIRQFQLGVSDDGQRCRIAFADEERNIIEWIAEYGEFSAFVTTLCGAAAEMLRRQSSTGEPEPQQACRPIDVSSAAFREHPSDGSVVGAIVSNNGDVVGLRMHPETACRISRDLLLATAAAGHG